MTYSDIAYSEAVARIFHTLRNGVVYGGKVRGAHSIVMSILFRPGPLKTKLYGIMKLTVEHAARLAVFASLYKALQLLISKLRGRDHIAHGMIAGTAAAAVAWGDQNSSIAQQVALYMLSRSISGITSYANRQGLIPAPWWGFRAFSALSWGMAMLLFELDRGCLQKSLTSSQVFIFDQGDRPWNGFTDWIMGPSADPKK